MKQSFNNNKKYSSVHGIIIKSENCFDASLLIQAVLILILKLYHNCFSLNLLQNLSQELFDTPPLNDCFEGLLGSKGISTKSAIFANLDLVSYVELCNFSSSALYCLLALLPSTCSSVFFQVG